MSTTAEQLLNMGAAPDEDFKFQPDKIDGEISGSMGINGTMEGAAEDVAEEEDEGQERPQEGQPEAEPEQQESTSFSISEFIDAETAVEFLGWALGKATIPINRKTGLDISPKEMDFDAKEKKTLVKPLEKVFQDGKIGTKNPLLAFLLIFMLMVGIKFWMASMDAQERKKQEIEDGNEEEAGQPKKSRKSRATGGKRGRPRKAKLSDLKRPEMQQQDIII